MLRFFANLVFALLLFAPTVHGAESEEDLNLLRLYYRDKDLIFAPTRNLQPVSRTAENITIITAEEIEKMNAHTLTDVLNTIPGVEVEIRGGPGVSAPVVIQGSEMHHVLVLLDGVKLNSLGENIPDIASIPVQIIERVEILKGPGSSAWGSSLGGVINIITKSPNETKPFSGFVSSSYGEHRTGDYRAEATGTQGRLGYYVYGGYLTSGGFGPQTSAYESNAYSKLTWNLPDKGNVVWTGNYMSSSRGEGQSASMGMFADSDLESFFSTLALNLALRDDLDANLSLRAIKNHHTMSYGVIGGSVFQSHHYNDYTMGASAKVSYRRGVHTLVVGGDLDDGRLHLSSDDSGHSLRTAAIFANDVIALGRLSIIPGIRYDHTNTNGGFTSPSLGVAYRIGETTFLRAYGVRGFNAPPPSWKLPGSSPNFIPNPNLDVEKVTSIQVGMESFAMRYVWLKVTLFRHDIMDAITPLPGVFTYVNSNSQRRQGVEAEIKTRPFYGTSLIAGTAYIDAWDRDTREPIPNAARYTWDIGVEYNGRTFYALLKGHYITFHSDPEADTQDTAFVWDFHAAKTIYTRPHSSAQLFLSVHNLFNGAQFLDANFQNPSRWVEGGVRIRF